VGGACGMYEKAGRWGSRVGDFLEDLGVDMRIC